MPLYVRAGSILPLDPVRQYTDEPVDGPLTLQIDPGADGAFTLYEDDGKTFDHRRGAWIRVDMRWRDAARRLTLRLAPGSRLPPPARRATGGVRFGPTGVAAMGFRRGVGGRQPNNRLAGHRGSGPRFSGRREPLVCLKCQTGTELRLLQFAMTISKLERVFTVELTGEDGTVHASIDKTLPIRRAEVPRATWSGPPADVTHARR